MISNTRALKKAVSAMVAGSFLLANSWFFLGTGFAQKRDTDSLSLVVTPRGILPSKVTLRPGPLSITIVNRTGYQRAEYQITQVDGGRLVGTSKIDPLLKRSLRVNTVVVLTPGEYNVSVVDSPNVFCRITIQP